jgi:hypothetical protein
VTTVPTTGVPGDHGPHHDHGGAGVNPAVPAPTTPPRVVASTPPVAVVPVKPTPPSRTTPPVTAPVNANVAAREAAVAAYNPPTDDCGPQPAYAVADPSGYAALPPAKLEAAQAALPVAQKWLACRTHWFNQYKVTIEALNARVGDKGGTAAEALGGIKGGPAVAAAYVTAHTSVVAEQTELRAHQQALLQARNHLPGGRP